MKMKNFNKIFGCALALVVCAVMQTHAGGGFGGFGGGAGGGFGGRNPGGGNN